MPKKLQGYKITRYGNKVKLSWFWDYCKCGRIKQKVSPHCRWCCFNTYHCFPWSPSKNRNEKIISELKAHKLSQVDIAKKYGISKQRVNQILHAK